MKNGLRLNISRLKYASTLSLFFLLLTACSDSSHKEEVTRYTEYRFSTESAVKGIEIAKLLQAGNTVSEDHWENLFASEGYKNYLIYSNAEAQKELIKDAIETVFDPNRIGELDSLLSLPVTMGKNFYKLILIRNFARLKKNLVEAEEFIYEDFNPLIASGDSLARLFLPESIQDSLPRLYDCHLILSDPDAKVMDNAIVLDLNMALEKGKDELLKIIAHEFHHNYRKLAIPSFTDPLMIEINKVHQEGVADLIDKKKPPIHESLYPEVFIEMYNLEYASTAETLGVLDSLTHDFLTQKIDTTAYHDQLKSFFPIGGHPNGFYMALEIAEHRGKEVLIETYNDPFEFIRIYNEVAKDSQGNHVFSSAFMNYLEELKKY